MANKNKHANRSKRSSHDRKIGMLYMDETSNLKTYAHKRLKKAKEGVINE